jgi:hypothetical protein
MIRAVAPIRAQALELVAPARTAKGGTMNNKLFTFRKNGRMTCAWISTGDAKMPLACVWVEAEAPGAVSTASFSEDDARGVRLCA